MVTFFRLADVTCKLGRSKRKRQGCPFPVHEGIWEGGKVGIAPFILYVGLGGSFQLHAPAALSTRKEALVTTENEATVHCSAGMNGEKSLPWMENRLSGPWYSHYGDWAISVLLSTSKSNSASNNNDQRDEERRKQTCGVRQRVTLLVVFNSKYRIPAAADKLTNRASNVETLLHWASDFSYSITEYGATIIYRGVPFNTFYWYMQTTGSAMGWACSTLRRYKNAKFCVFLYLSTVKSESIFKHAYKYW
jgi:hypothetical protein